MIYGVQQDCTPNHAWQQKLDHIPTDNLGNNLLKESQGDLCLCYL